MFQLSLFFLHYIKGVKLACLKWDRSIKESSKCTFEDRRLKDGLTLMCVMIDELESASITFNTIALSKDANKT